MIKAVIFDFFDVIRTDSYKSWLATNNISREGPYFDASYQMDLGNITVDQFLQRLSDLTGRPITQEEVDASAKVDFAVIRIIKLLRESYKVALLSNAPSTFIREILKKHDLDQYFDEIIVSSEVGMVKPSAEIFEHALSKLGVNASEVVFIDDNAGHIAAAEKIGIKGIQFLSANQLKGDLTTAGINLEA